VHVIVSALRADFDRIVIHGYLSGLSRPEQVVHFFRQVVGAPVVSKQAAGYNKNV
jgi:hypothetical protein